MNEAPAAVCPTSLAFQMLGAAHEVEARLESALDRIGLSVAKFGVLAKLVEAGEPLALGCLAERSSCVRSNMTQLVDRLEAERFVERVNDPSDRRSVRAALTPAGRERHAEGVRVVEEAGQAVFASLDDAERATLKRVLAHLGRNP
ncbi:MAG TPA: MarR family transcriptional regulator [Thermoanaerobaculia bacterium]|jgi:DNA-binding MarR family transcriptional regulator|nr:MarR family transcriptional regulator [Thermoanaerobaculia bacterium]